MTTYVVTVPGTFLEAPTARTREALVRALRSADPRGTDFGEAENLDILTVYEGSPAFSLHLEVEAESAPAAQESARELVMDALRTAGHPEGAAALGVPVITGIDTD